MLPVSTTEVRERSILISRLIRFIESLTVRVGFFHAIFVQRCRTDEATLVLTRKAAMYAEPGRAPPPPRHAPSAAMVKSRKSQRNNNDIRVHDFVLSGAPLKRALPFFASPTLWRLFATMLAQACERYLDRERSVLECSTSGQCGFARSSSAPTTLSDRSDAIAAEPPLIEWRVVCWAFATAAIGTRPTAATPLYRRSSRH